MLYIRPEGGLLRNGLNFYPLSEWKYSRGFIFRWNGYAKWFRFSVTKRQWIFESVRLSDHTDDSGEADSTIVIDISQKF